MRKLQIVFVALFLLLLAATHVFAQNEPISRQEMLRGSVTPEREWWDVLHYHQNVEFLLETRRLKGSNVITFKTLKPGKKMQIDLQPPGFRVLNVITFAPFNLLVSSKNSTF